MHGQYNLIFQLVKREISARYRGSALGILWSLITPLCMLAIYMFIFSQVFNARWGAAIVTNKLEFSLAVFSGLTLNNIFIECLNRAPGIIVGNTNYVKRVVFPLQSLPVVAFISSLFNACINIVILLVAEIAIKGYIPATAIYFPAILMPFILTMMGVYWILSAIGVFLRDLSHITGIATMALMFLSPIFYPIEAIAMPYRRLLYLNPMTYVIESARNAIVFGKAPSMTPLIAFYICGFAIYFLGYWMFSRMKKGFCDVI